MRWRRSCPVPRLALGTRAWGDVVADNVVAGARPSSPWTSRGALAVAAFAAMRSPARPRVGRRVRRAIKRRPDMRDTEAVYHHRPGRHPVRPELARGVPSRTERELAPRRRGEQSPGVCAPDPRLAGTNLPVSTGIRRYLSPRPHEAPPLLATQKSSKRRLFATVSCGQSNGSAHH